MASANNTIKTRIQLKSDTEENWRKSVLTTDSPNGLKQSGTSFVPLQGELIVYLADSTHPFSRLKVGNGVTNVVDLDFIDTVTLNGKQPEIVTADIFDNLPQPGSTDKLYIVTSTHTIYNFASGTGYQKLSNFEYTPQTILLNGVGNFYAGQLGHASVTNNILNINFGVLPSLVKDPRTVVTSLTRT